MIQRFIKSTSSITVCTVLSVALMVPYANALTVQGITEPFLDATLSSTVAGRIASINISDGGHVDKGQVIVSLASEQETLEVARRKLIANNTAELNAATSKVDTLKTETEATQELFTKTQSVSREDLQKKILEYTTAREELANIKVNKAKENLEYKIALSQLNERTIVAPFSGVVVKHFLQAGENCNPQQALIRLADTSTCRFIAYIEDGLTHKMKVGKKVSLLIGDSKFRLRKTGTIEHVSPVVDPASGLREIRVLFDNTDGRINPGVPGTMTVE